MRCADDTKHKKWQIAKAYLLLDTAQADICPTTRLFDNNNRQKMVQSAKSTKFVNAPICEHEKNGRRIAVCCNSKKYMCNRRYATACSLLPIVWGQTWFVNNSNKAVRHGRTASRLQAQEQKS